MIKKVVILAGGYGTRISEETDCKPKPMIEIGGMPILWHIMKHYSHYDLNEFVICLGYKSYVIKEFFANYHSHTSDFTIDLSDNSIEIHSTRSEPWKVTLVDTGLNSMTGGRLGRIKKYVEDESAFCMTYGDGLSDVNVSELIKFHEEKKSLATLTAIKPAGRFGALEIDGDKNIKSFLEKPQGDGNYVNGGFFVLDPKVFDYITEGDGTVWEQKPLMNLAKDNHLSAYKHSGFWQPMDTLRDKKLLEEMWDSGNPPWKKW